MCVCVCVQQSSEQAMAVYPPVRGVPLAAGEAADMALGVLHVPDVHVSAYELTLHVPIPVIHLQGRAGQGGAGAEKDRSSARTCTPHAGSGKQLHGLMQEAASSYMASCRKRQAATWPKAKAKGWEQSTPPRQYSRQDRTVPAVLPFKID